MDAVSRPSSAAFHTRAWRCRHEEPQMGPHHHIGRRTAGRKPREAAYVAAKHGIVGLSKVIAIEAANEGVTCNAICRVGC